ncbi:MAG: 2-hydroxyacid dehydrogenase [Candidatus Heimdallarchaeota archaeon]
MKPKVIVDAQRQLFHDDVVELLCRKVHAIFEPIKTVKEEQKDTIAIIALGVQVNEEFLQQVPALKLIARFGVGYDTVDVGACTRRGVYVTITSHVLSEAVAELTLGLIIGVARNIVNADRYTRKEWAKKQRSGPYGIDLKQKTLGIVGLGQIGFQVAKRAHAFEMKLLYTDIVPQKEAESLFGAKRAVLNELLQESDFISLHVPLNAKTRGLIGKKELELMKPTAYLINTSRGAVVDQKALVEVLQRGQISGAGLDVYDPEPVPLNDPLLGLPNVLITPHIGSATVETRKRMGMSCVNEVLRILRNERPVNVVPEQGGLTF